MEMGYLVLVGPIWHRWEKGCPFGNNKSYSHAKADPSEFLSMLPDATVRVSSTRIHFHGVNFSPT